MQKYTYVDIVFCIQKLNEIYQGRVFNLSLPTLSFIDILPDVFRKNIMWTLQKCSSVWISWTKVSTLRVCCEVEWNIRDRRWFVNRLLLHYSDLRNPNYYSDQRNFFPRQITNENINLSCWSFTDCHSKICLSFAIARFVFAE